MSDLHKFNNELLKALRTQFPDCDVSEATNMVSEGVSVFGAAIEGDHCLIEIYYAAALHLGAELFANLDEWFVVLHDNLNLNILGILPGYDSGPDLIDEIVTLIRVQFIKAEA